jgi:hypothetical protein
LTDKPEKINHKKAAVAMKTYKVYFLLAAYMFSLILSCSESNDNQCKISGSISGNSDDFLFLKKIHDRQMLTIDSARVHEGNFNFSPILLQSPEMLYVQIGNRKSLIQLFAENSDIIMEIPADNIEKTLISGSSVHAEYADFLENNEAYNNKLTDVYKRKLIAAENRNADLVRDLDSLKNLLLREQESFLYRYALENDDSYTALYITSESLSQHTDYAILRKILDNFSLKLSVSPYYEKIKQKLELKASLAAGAEAPDLSFLKSQKPQNYDYLWLLFPYPEVDFMKQAAVAVENSQERSDVLNMKAFAVLPESISNNHPEIYARYTDIEFVFTDDIRYESLRKKYDLNYALKSFIVGKDSVILKSAMHISQIEDYIEYLYEKTDREP